MMDVSGTDPRTRTGLFLWPWASYPAVAANAAAAAGSHTQQIMMGGGANMNGSVGANMLGMSSSNSVNVPTMIEDPFETFYQRFSYTGAHAHMSHILPQNQLQPASSESRHVPRDRISDGSSGVQQNLALSLSNSRGHGQSAPRLLSPQPRHHNQTQRSDTGLIDPTSISGRVAANSHAAAIAAFASVAATSGIVSSTENCVHTGHLPRHIEQDGPRSTASGEAVLDGLCNGLGRPGMHFSNHLSTGCPKLLNEPNSNSSASPENGGNSSHVSKTQADPTSAYNHLRSQQLKEFSNTAAALAAAATASDHAPFPGHVTQGQDLHTVDRTAHEKLNDRELNRQPPLDECSGRGHVSSQPSAELYHTPHPHYPCPSKSPMSDTCEQRRELSHLHRNDDHASRNSMDLMRSGRFVSGIRDRPSALLFRNHSLRGDCSPDTNSEYRSCELLMNAAMSARESTRTAAASGTSNNSSRGSHCNLDNSLPSVTNGSNTSYASATKGYKCKICQHVCFSRHDLSAHNAAIHKQDPRPYRCEQCGRQFTTCAYLSQHRRIHTGVKPYACRYCDRRFTQLSHVQQHERIHTGEKPYRCTTCMKSFTQMSNLQSHQRQHMKGKPHRCEQCFMSFDSKDELDLHVQAKHSGNRYAKVLVCPICTKSYNSETYLAKHMDRHKEAASTTLTDGGSVNSVHSSVDDLFVAGFHTHPMAMAAAALSRGGGAVNLPQPSMAPGGHFQGRQNHSHIPTHNQPPGVAAAADVAARCVAAAAAAEGGSARVDSVTRPFFNSSVCGLGEQRSSSPHGTGLHNAPLNYSAESELFHHLPASLHSSRAAYLVAAAAASQQQQQQHQSNASFGKLPQLPHPFGDFRPSVNFGLGAPDHYQAEVMHARRELNQLVGTTHTGRSMSACGGHTPSPHPPYVGSPAVGEQQLLNLTREQSLGRTGKHIAPSSSSSSPAEVERYTTTPHTHAHEVKPHHQNYHHRQQSHHNQQLLPQNSIDSEQSSMVPPPAHQHCIRMDYEGYQVEARPIHQHLGMNNCRCSTLNIQDAKSPEPKSTEVRRTLGNSEGHAYAIHPTEISPEAQSPNLLIPTRSVDCKRETPRQMTPERESEDASNLRGREPSGHSRADTPSSGHLEGELHHPIQSQQLARQSPLDENKSELLLTVPRLQQQQNLNDTQNEHHVDVPMEPSNSANSRSPKSIDNHTNGTQASTVHHAEGRHGTNSTAPLLTPHAAVPNDSASLDRLNTNAVSELAKITSRGRNLTMDPRLSMCRSPSPSSGASTDLVTVGLHEPSGNVLKKDDYVKHSAFLQDRLSNSSSPLSVEMKATDMPEHVRNMNTRGSTGMFDEDSQILHNMFYAYNAPTEDLIKSSWATKELISPKSTSVEIAALGTKGTAGTRAAISLPRDRTDYSQTSAHQVDDGIKMGTPNAPFYLNAAWRQYNQEHRTHRIKDFVSQEPLPKRPHQNRHPFSPTTPPPSPIGIASGADPESPNSGKRRRCHPYNSQSVSNYETSEVHKSTESVNTAYPTYYRVPSHQRLSDNTYGEVNQTLGDNHMTRSTCPSAADGSPMTSDYTSDQTDPSRPVKAPHAIATEIVTTPNTGLSLSFPTGFSFRPQV